jgi:predicted nucleotidyltransferase
MGAGQRVREHRDEILRVAASYGAGNVLLFGSVVRGEDTPESDVDLLVDVTGETTVSRLVSQRPSVERIGFRRCQNREALYYQVRTPTGCV